MCASAANSTCLMWKVRSRRVAQHRARRALAVVSRVVLVAALCVAIYAGTREAARRLFFENSDYQLKTIDSQDGRKRCSAEQILNAADLREGENIFRVNLGRVHDLIQQLPQTMKCRLCENLPSEIDIRVVDESQSRGSRAKKKFPIRLHQTRLF